MTKPAQVILTFVVFFRNPCKFKKQKNISQVIPFAYAPNTFTTTDMIKTGNANMHDDNLDC
eukprot:m.127820 g.127820  ORF g.127820 m.127820 type:complete len:61 (+) comp29299_c0_seq2:1590-1772(+)